jgi:perosamine synthetase
MIPISIPHLYKQDTKLAIDAIKSGFIAHGPNIELFEQEYSLFCNRKYGVSCSNGTTALYLAIKSLKLPQGSEVIVPSMTIISCLTAIIENGLVPVFCDVNSETWNIDITSVRQHISTNTSAILVVDTYGLVVNVDEILQLKLDFPDIKIIEDASEAHGASYKDYKAGSIGDVSTFSFYANKIITTGEGGMVLTNDEQIYNELMLLRNLNFVDRKRYIHNAAGSNFRMTNIQCSIGLGQLKNIDKTIKHRKRIAKQYNKMFTKCNDIQIPYTNKNHDNVYWYYSIIIKKNRDAVIKALEQHGIDYRCFFYPLHKQPFIQNTSNFPVTEYLSENGLILPTYTKLTNKQIKVIAKTILEQL